MRLGRETTVTALGKAWKLSRTTVAVIEAYRAYVVEKTGDPFAPLERFAATLGQEKAFLVFKECDAVKQQLDQFSLSCPLALAHMDTELGGAQMVWLLLQQHHPTATPDDALAILEEIGAENMRKKAAETQGHVPNSRAPETPAPAPAETAAVPEVHRG